MRLPVDSPYDLLPGGRRVKGGNLVGTPPFTPVGTANDYWAVYWSRWRWADQVKPQIDRCIALGHNAVRIIGTYQGITNGYLTQAQYHQRVQQLSDYCYDNGMYVFLCAGAQNDGGNNTTTAERDVVAAALAAYAHTLPNIAGIDLMQESYPQVPLSQMTTLVAAAKAETDIPVTFSLDGVKSKSLLTGDANGLTYMAEMKDLVDYFDVHLYYNPASTDLANNYWPATSKPLMAGEFGSNASEATNIRQSRFNSVRDNFHNSVTDGVKRTAGSLVWAMGDQNTIASDSWGIADNDGNYRTDTANIFATYPAGPAVDLPARTGSGYRLGGETVSASGLLDGTARTISVQAPTAP